MKHFSKKMLSIFFIAIITIVSIVNIGMIGKIIAKPIKQLSLKTVVGQIKKAYHNDILWRTGFIDINGLFARLSGLTVSNDIARLKNGMLLNLIYTSSSSSLSQTSKRFIDVANAIKSLGIPFLYVDLPMKLDVNNELLPVGLSLSVHSDTDNFISALQNAGVEVIDTRPLLVATSEDVKKYFYTTDHHWNARGALKVAPTIASKIGTMLSINDLDLTRLEETNWTCHVKKDWWFGSEGQRAGRFYGNMDDLIYFTPNFETKMIVIIPEINELRKGNFEEANFVKRYIEQRVDSHKTSAYYVYMGRNSGLVNRINEDKTQPKKVLIVQDSYMLPLQGFLSMIFQEVDVIDLRYFKECSLIDYVKKSSPDIVVMAFSYSTRYRHMEKRLDLRSSIVGDNLEHISIEESFTVNAIDKNNYNFVTLPPTLKNGETYVLTIQNTEVLKGMTDGISLSLYDLNAKKRHTCPLFDVDYTNRHGGIRWEFTVPKSGTWKMLAYAGIVGKTQGISIKYHNVKLTKRVP